MGAGIAEVFARNGFEVIGVEQSTTRRSTRGRQHLEHSTGRAVDARQAHRGRAGRAARPDHVHHRDEGPGRRRLRRRGRRGVDRDQEGRLPRARRHRRSRDAILATNTSSLSVTEISTANARPGRVVGVHFFNPAPVQNLVEMIRTVVTEPDVLDDVQALLEPARQEPRGLRRPGRLHRQHAAVRLPEPRGRDVRGPLRHPRGHRRGDAVRLRLPDGPARAAGPDRSRHGVRDPRHDVQAGPRPPARAGADPQADGHRRAARPEVRPRLLHLRGGRQLEGRARPPDAVAPTTSRGCAATSPASAWSAPAPWPAGIAEVFAKAGYDVLYVGRSDAKVEAVPATIERSLDKAVQRGKLEESPRPRRSAG